MIEKYPNFFSDPVLKMIDEKLESIFNTNEEKPIFSSSISHWDRGLIGNGIPILRYILSGEDLSLSQSLKKEIEGKISYYVNDIVIHICPKLSYIPWHNDSGHTAALSIYLSKKWNPNWGGYFMYSNENGDVSSILPERNLGILQKGGLWHSVSTINIEAEYRISLQCFLKSQKKFI